MSLVEEIYRAAVDAMTPAQKIARMHGFFNWMRDLYTRQIRAAHTGISDERLKWEVALRIYGSDPRTKELIEDRIRNVRG